VHGRSRGRERENFNKRVGGFRPFYAAGAKHAKSGNAQQESGMKARASGLCFQCLSFFCSFLYCRQEQFQGGDEREREKRHSV